MRKLFLVFLAAPWTDQPAEQPFAQAKRALQPTRRALAFRTQHRQLRTRETNRAEARAVVRIEGPWKLEIFSDRLKAGAREEPGHFVSRRGRCGDGRKKQIPDPL